MVYILIYIFFLLIVKMEVIVMYLKINNNLCMYVFVCVDLCFIKF